MIVHGIYRIFFRLSLWTCRLLLGKYHGANGEYEYSLLLRAKISGRRLNVKKNDYQVNIKKSKFYLPFYNSDLIQKTIIANKNYYEAEYLNFCFFELKGGLINKNVKGKAFLDIGTNIGNHALFFINEIGFAKGYCFEPIKKIYDILYRNIEINNCLETIKLYNCGVGEKSGIADIKEEYEGNLGGTSISLSNNGNIPIKSIDELEIKDEIKFIKIDTEGFELQVIKGALKTVSANMPFIMIEIRPDAFDEINRILAKFGYEYFKYDDMNYIYFPNDK